jgi:hypothetical protein
VRREYPVARHPHARDLVRCCGVLPVPLRRCGLASGPRGLPDFGALVLDLRLLRRGDAREAPAVRGIETSGVLLDFFPAGPVLHIGRVKTLICWERPVLAQLVED